MPKRISFHSHSDEPSAVRFQNHLIKEYTLENEFKLYEYINTLDQMQDGLKTYKASSAINHRLFDEKYQLDLNTEAFLNANIFLKRKRKRHNPGSKLQFSEPQELSEIWCCEKEGNDCDDEENLDLDALLNDDT